MAEDANELRAEAQRLFHPNDPHGHWSVKARLLEAILRQDLWQTWGFGSGRAWAEAELDLSPGEFVALTKLARLMAQVQPPLEPGQWLSLSRAKAQLLLRIAPVAGAALSRWVQEALQEPLAALRTRVDEAMGLETWQTWSVRVPAAVAALADAALVAALTVDDCEPAGTPEEWLRNRTLRFQAFEYVIATYLAGVR